MSSPVATPYEEQDQDKERDIDDIDVDPDTDAPLRHDPVTEEPEKIPEGTAESIMHSVIWGGPN